MSISEVLRADLLGSRNRHGRCGLRVRSQPLTAESPPRPAPTTARSLGPLPGEQLDSQLLGKPLLFRGLVTFYVLLTLPQSKIFERNVSSRVLYLRDNSFSISIVFFLMSIFPPNSKDHLISFTKVELVTLR